MLKTIFWGITCAYSGGLIYNSIKEISAKIKSMINKDTIVLLNKSDVQAKENHKFDVDAVLASVKDNKNIDDVYFAIFDFLTLDEWKQKKCQNILKDRKKLLNRQLGTVYAKEKLKYLKLISKKIVYKLV